MTGPGPAQVDGYLDKIEVLIAQYGHAVQFVFGDEPVDHFSYTVGLHAVGLPELWVGTLGPDQGKDVLNGLVRLLRDRGVEALEPGFDPGPDLAEWFGQFRIRGPVSPEAAAVGVARRIAERDGDDPDGVAVYQVFWPDPAGRFPTDAGYDQGAWPQRVLPLEGSLIDP